MNARRTDHPASGRSRRLPKTRLEAFSDGVFAIVVTQPVLDLNAPPPSAPIGPALLADWMRLNPLLLLFVSFLPSPPTW